MGTSADGDALGLLLARGLLWDIKHQDAAIILGLDLAGLRLEGTGSGNRVSSSVR